jgi:hypothetical protein
MVVPHTMASGEHRACVTAMVAAVVSRRARKLVILIDKNLGVFEWVREELVLLSALMSEWPGWEWEWRSRAETGLL